MKHVYHEKAICRRRILLLTVSWWPYKVKFRDPRNGDIAPIRIRRLAECQLGTLTSQIIFRNTVLSHLKITLAMQPSIILARHRINLNSLLRATFFCCLLVLMML